MLWLGQHSSGTAMDKYATFSKYCTTFFMILLLQCNVNTHARIAQQQRSLELLDLHPNAINLTLALKYIPEDIAQTLFEKDKQNSYVYEFCRIVNDQVGYLGAIMALEDEVTLFTSSDYVYPHTGCEIKEVRYPVPSWDIAEGVMGIEVSLIQIVFASDNTSSEEIVEYVKRGFQNYPESFLTLLREIISTVEEVEVLDMFSALVSAPSMPPSVSVNPSEAPSMPPSVSVNPSEAPSSSPTVSVNPSEAPSSSPTVRNNSVSVQLSEAPSSSSSSSPPVGDNSVSVKPSEAPSSASSSSSSSSPTVEDNEGFDIQWDKTGYLNDEPPRLNDNDDSETQPPNNTFPASDLENPSNSATLTIISAQDSKHVSETHTIPVAYIAAIAASTSAVVVLVLFLLYFFTRKNNARKKREEQFLEQPLQSIKKQSSAGPPPAPLPKVPSYIDIEEMQSVDDSTIGEHTAGRKPEKPKPLLPIPSESQHSQSSQKQRKPLTLNVDYEEEIMYPNRAHTPGTASPSLSSSSRVTPRASTRKSFNRQLAINTTPPTKPPITAPMEPLFSPVTFYSDQDQSPEQMYDDPDPEPVVMSSDSESEAEKIFLKNRFTPTQPEPKPYQNKSIYSPSQQYFSSPPKIPDNKLRNEKQIQTFQNPLTSTPLHKHKLPSNDEEGSNGSKEGDNPWLFEAVKETLGPRGASADMESLGERSRHSYKSHRSSRHRRKKEGSSVGSRGSKTSLKSYRSHRSQVSKAQSEASRSVAIDLLRLENQLSSISKTDSNTAASVHSHTSKSTSTSKRRTMRNFIKLSAPAGKLGVILANRTEKPGTVVSDVRPTSPLHGKIFPGDRIVSIDGENVSMIPVSEITSIMARKADFERVLTVLTCKNGLKM